MKGNFLVISCIYIQKFLLKIHNIIQHVYACRPRPHKITGNKRPKASQITKSIIISDGRYIETNDILAIFLVIDDINIEVVRTAIRYDNHTQITLIIVD